jgi:hypothetical protein
MQAAQADQAIISLCAAVPFDGSPSQMKPSETEVLLRNWTDKSRAFVTSRLKLISNPELREQASQSIARFERLRNARNRVIHDAVEVGIDFDGTTHSLAVEFRKGEGVFLHTVTAEQIAALACEVYELNQDLKFILSSVRDSGPAT